MNLFAFGDQCCSKQSLLIWYLKNVINEDFGEGGIGRDRESPLSEVNLFAIVDQCCLIWCVKKNWMN